MGIDIFQEMEKNGVEQITFTYDKVSGLKAITSIHDTTIGPALGGCRMWKYDNTDDAIMDAIRLSVGMTYKCSVAGTSFGGGKTVIIGDSKTDKSEAMFRALGRSIEILNGRYYTGPDVGISADDLLLVRQESKYMVGLPEEYGGGGNTAIPTAYGVYMGIKAAVRTIYGNESLKDLRFAVQGVGKVGSLIVDYLIEEGGRVVISNRSDQGIQKIKDRYPQVEVVDANEIYDQECDVFVPCALGGIINDETIPKLKCKIIAGPANNQLAEERHGQVLHDRGILYVPDFVINSGGLIQASDELDMEELNHDRVMAKTKNIYNTLLKIFHISKSGDMPTYKAANKLAEERIEMIGQIKRRYVRP